MSDKFKSFLQFMGWIVGIAIVFCLLLLLYPHIIALKNTEYAAGYSRKNFKMLEVDMTKEVVVEIMGEPLDSYIYPHTGGEYYVYSRKKNNNHRYEKTVTFHDGKLTAINSNLVSE